MFCLHSAKRCRFEKIKVQEDDCNAVATEYWTYKDGQSHYDNFLNQQPDPLGMSGHDENKGTIFVGRDTCSSVTRGPTYYAGTFKWTIPCRYYINGNDRGVFANVDMDCNLAKTTADQRTTVKLSHEKAEMYDEVKKEW